MKSSVGREVETLLLASMRVVEEMMGCVCSFQERNLTKFDGVSTNRFDDPLDNTLIDKIILT